ncbi:hypothetical protein NDN08_008368 [Rhodosorus marinus]|uniref:Vesicle tethering protein Uso1/P115-like head domain-containing protein n=1 Tax=Rhodosorus marinus TaxID=101924 RepID=A0AAV8V472_9RHOD|nr:hypothetical protein NDN08_008368 [Rhodosorus marinus]
MNVLSGALNYIAGNDRVEGISPVRRLVERIKTSSLPQDRRKSIRDLNRAVQEGPHRQEEIGSDGLRVIFAVLEQDRQMQDTIVASLELLNNACCALDPPTSAEEDENLDTSEFKRRSAAAASRNTQLFARINNAVSLLIELLEEEEFYVRFNTVELLTAMVGNETDLLVSEILASSMGLSRLVDLLNDSRDVIRNEGLLLLIALSGNSEELSKILTFESVFDKLFSIINTVKAPVDRSEEDLVDAKEGAILVHDCLHLIQNILRHSGSNVALFREAEGIEKIAKLIRIVDVTMRTIVAEDVDNLVAAIDIVSLLCDGADSDAGANRSSCAGAGIVERLWDVLDDRSSSVHVKASTVNCLALVVRKTQAGMSRLLGRSRNPYQFVLDELYSSESAGMRGACCLLAWELIADRNGSTRGDFMNSVFSDTSDGNPSLVEMSSRIKAAAVSSPSDDVDAASVFYSCTLLSWAVQRSKAPKLSRTQLLSATAGSKRENLLTKSVRSLSRASVEGSAPEVRVGILRLLCTWLHNSNDAMSEFQSSVMHLPLLVELMTRESVRGDTAEVYIRGLAAVIIASGLLLGDQQPNIKSTLADIVRKRIGVAAFTARLDDLLASEAFTSAQSGELILEDPLRLLKLEQQKGPRSGKGLCGYSKYFDPDFTKLVGEVYEKSRSTMMELMIDAEGSTLPQAPSFDRPPSLNVNGGGDEEIILHYKEIIRSQDAALAESREEGELLKQSLNSLQADVDNNMHFVQDGCVKNRSGAEDDEQMLARSEKIAALERALQTKGQEMEALAGAYSQLEEELVSGASARTPSASYDSRADELNKLVEAEKRNAFKLETRLMQLELSEKTAKAEAEAFRGQLKELSARINSTTDGSISQNDVEVLEERKRREIAEEKLNFIEEQGEARETSERELKERVLEAERMLAEATSKTSRLQNKVQSQEHDIETLKTKHMREVELSRAASVTLETSLQEEIARLEQELAEAESKDSEREIQKLQEEKDELGEDIVRFTAQIAGLKSESEDLRTRRRNLEQELDEVSTAHLELKTQFEQVNKEHVRESAENQRLASLVRELQDSEAAAQKDLTLKSEEVNGKEEKLRTLQSRIAELESTTKAVEKALAGSKTDSADLTDQIVRLSERLVATEDSRQGLERELQLAQEDITRLKEIKPPPDSTDPHVVASSSVPDASEVSDLRAMLAGTQEALREAENDIEVLRAKDTDAREVVAREMELRDILDRSRERYELTEKRCADLEAEIEDSREQHSAASLAMQSRLQEQDLELKMALSQVETERQLRLEGERKLDECADDQHTSSIMETSSRIPELESEVANLSTKLTKFEEDRLMLASQVDRLESQLSMQTASIRDVLIELNVSTSEIESDRATVDTYEEEAIAQLEEIQKALKGLREDRDSAEKKSRLLEGRNSELIEALARSEEVAQDQTLKLDDYRLKTEELEGHLRDERESRSLTEDEIQQKEKDLAMFKERVVSAELQIKVLESTVQENEEMMEKLDQELTVANKCAEEAEERVKKLVEKEDSSSKALQKGKAALESDLEALESQLRGERKEKAALESDLEALESQLRGERKENAALESDRAALESQLRVEQKEKAALESDQAALESQLRREQKEKAALESDREALESQLRGELDILQSERSALENQLEKQNQVLEVAEVRSSERVEKVKLLEDQLNETRSEIVQLRDLKSTISDQESENSRISKLLDEVTSEMRDLEADLETLRSENTEKAEALVLLTTAKETAEKAALNAMAAWRSAAAVPEGLKADEGITIDFVVNSLIEELKTSADRNAEFRREKEEADLVVSHWMDEIEKLESKTLRMEASAQDWHQEKEALQESVRRLEGVCRELRAERDESDMKARTSEEKLAETIIALAESRELLDAESLKAKRRVLADEKLNRGLLELESNILRVEKVLEEKNKTLEVKEKEFQGLLSGKEETIDRLTNSLKSSEEVIHGKDLQLNKAAKLAERAETERDNLAQELAIASKTATSRVEELDKEIKLRDVRIEEQYAAFSSTEKQLRSDLSAAGDELHSALENVKEVEALEKHARDKASKNEEERDLLSSKLDDLRTRLADADLTAQQIQKSAEEKEAELERSSKRFEGEIDAVQKLLENETEARVIIEGELEESKSSLILEQGLRKERDKELGKISAALDTTSEKLEEVQKEKLVLTESLKQKQTETTGMEEDLITLRAENAELSKKTNDLSSALEDVGSQLNSAIETSDSRSQRIDSLTEQLNNLHVENTGLIETRKQLELELDKLTAELDSAHETSDSRLKQIDILEEQLGDKRNLIEILKTRSEDSESRIASLEKESLEKKVSEEEAGVVAGVLRETIEQLEANLLVLEEKSKASQQSVIFLQEQVLRFASGFPTLKGGPLASLNEAPTDYVEVLSRVEAEGQNLRSELLKFARRFGISLEDENWDSLSDSVIRSDPGTLSSAENTFNERIASLRVELSAEVSRRKALAERVAELERELKTSYMEASRTSYQLEENSRALEAIEARSSQLEEQSREASRRHAEERKSYRAEVDSKVKELEDAKADLSTTHATLKSLQRKLGQNELDLKSASKEASDLRKELTNIDSLKSDYASARTRNLELVEKLRSLEEARRMVESESRENLARVKTEIAEYSSQLSESASKITSLEDETNLLRGTVDRMRRTRDALEDENARLRSQVDKLSSSKSAQAYEREMQDLTEENSQLEERIRSLESDLYSATATKQRIHLAEQEKAAVEQRLRKSSEELQESREAARKAEKMVGDSMHRKDSLESELWETQRKLLEAEEELAATLEDRMVMEETLAVLHQEQSAIAAKSQQVEDLEMRVDDLMLQAAEARGQAADANNLIEELEEKLRQAKRKSASAESVSNLGQRIRLLEGTVREKDQRIYELENSFRANDHAEFELMNARAAEREARDHAADVEKRLELATEELSHLVDQTLNPDEQGVADYDVLERERQIVDLEQERDNLLRANENLEARLQTLGRDLQSSFRPHHEPGDEKTNVDWESKYHRLQEEHDEVLQCLADLELNRED